MARKKRHRTVKRHFASVTAKSFVAYVQNNYPSKYGMPRPELYETPEKFIEEIKKRVPDFRDDNMVLSHTYMLRQVVKADAVPKMVNVYMNIFLVNDLYPLLRWYGMSHEEIERLYSEFTTDETPVR